MCVESSEKAGFAPKPQGYWNSEKGKNMRLFLEKYARRHNFDPLIAQNWYSVVRDSVIKSKVSFFNIIIIIL